MTTDLGPIMVSMMVDHPEVEEAFGRAALLLRRSRVEASRDLAYKAGVAFGRLVELAEAVEGEEFDEHARSVLRDLVIEAAWPPRRN